MSAKTHSFVGLYIGERVASARLLVASANFTLIRQFAEYLLHGKERETPLDRHLKAVQEGLDKASAFILESRDKQ
jgi:hypothetical protein